MKITTCGRALALLCASAVSASITNAETPGPDQPKPNIVFIMADDLGWGEVGCYGQEKIKPPTSTAWPGKACVSCATTPGPRSAPRPAASS